MEITPPERASSPDARVDIRRVGGNLHPLGDLFHRLMTASWPATIAFIFVTYLSANCVFAVVYALIGDLDHARAGSFEDCFFFSVQTMATIGYGVISPKGTVTNLVVSFEAITGIIAAALTTGLVFAKFSRPTARLLFTRTALIGTMDGKRVLMFRIANERSNRIMEATVHIALTRNERTKEGQPFRRIYDLKLQRDSSAIFVLTWMVFHTVDESSPLYGETAESLAKSDATIIVSLIGTDETLAQTVHSRHTYEHDEIIFDARFVDVLRSDAQGRILDFTRFHTYELVEEPDEG